MIHGPYNIKLLSVISLRSAPTVRILPANATSLVWCANTSRAELLVRERNHRRDIPPPPQKSLQSCLLILSKCINIKFHRTQHRSSLNEMRAKCQRIPFPIFYFLFSNCENSIVRSSFTRLASLAFVSSPTAGTWACCPIPFPSLLNCLIPDTTGLKLKLTHTDLFSTDYIVSFSNKLLIPLSLYILIDNYYAIDAM